MKKSIPELIVADLDGTLIDSKLNFNEIRAAAAIPATEDILAHVAALPLEERQAKMQVIHEFELKGAESGDLLAGVEQFFDWIRAKTLPLALCTRNSRLIAERVVDQFQMPVDFICAREDAAPKPDPDGLELILRKYSCLPESALYIGDYLYDLQAAESAKIPFVLFYSDQLPNYADRAQFVMNDFRELIRHFG